MGVILFNAGVLGLEASDAAMAAAGPLILLLDRARLLFFVSELALKLHALGPRLAALHPWAFFLPFMVVPGFAVLNLLVGLVVNAMQEAAESVREVERAEETAFEAEVLRRLGEIERRVGQASEAALK